MAFRNARAPCSRDTRYHNPARDWRCRWIELAEGTSRKSESGRTWSGTTCVACPQPKPYREDAVGYSRLTARRRTKFADLSNIDSAACALRRAGCKSHSCGRPALKGLGRLWIQKVHFRSLDRAQFRLSIPERSLHRLQPRIQAGRKTPQVRPSRFVRHGVPVADKR